MLDQWLASLSRTTLAILAIGVAIFLIILFDPPHTVCDTQKEQLNEAIESTFYIDPAKKEKILQSRFQRKLESCRYANSIGGCGDFFRSLYLLEKELDGLSQKCLPKLASRTEIRQSLWVGVELMVRLAWGEVPPETYMERGGWLSKADLALFCRLKQRMVRAFGSEKWQKFREAKLKELPGSESLPRKDRWERSLFSISCTKLL